MKKRLIALALGVLISVNLLQPTIASAANVPTAQSKTIILTKDEMAIGSEIKDPNVKVEVTYTGWLGEIDAAQNGVERGAINGKIAVLKEGSEIRFKITSTDPAAYYNFCYDKTRFTDDTYGWDDTGSGWYYYNTDMMNVMTYGQADGTTKFAAGPLFRPELKTFGRKINANTYAYQAVNGLMEYHFTAKYKPENNDYIPQGGVAEYLLGTALTINDEQIKELEETGTMTFLKGVTMGGTQDVSFQRAYHGLAELLGLKSGNPLDLYIEDSYENYLKYTITNRSASTVEGYYALLSYWPVTSYCPANEISPFESEYFFGHVLPLEVNLAPGESVEGKLYSVVAGWPTMTHKWIKFDSREEYMSFLRTDVLQYEFPGIQDILTIDRGQDGIQWMKDTFGIQILSGKNS